MNDTFDTLAGLRHEYTVNTLGDDAPSEPITLFSRWLQEAKEAQLPYNECALATAQNNKPSVRIVLLKRFDEAGFCWFTDSESNKGKALAMNPQAELLFYWQTLERQVRIQGKVKQLSAAQTKRYFVSRPRISQLSAYVSQQSAPIANRQTLVDLHQAADAQYKDTIPMPKRWRGYRLVPLSIEFWQGREHRLHDRILYTKNQQQWHKQRLQP